MRPDEPNPYPGVPRAYELARDSYDLMMRRYEFALLRVQTIAGLATTVAVAAPAIAQSRSTAVEFRDPRLYGALGAVALILFILLAVHIVGPMILISPKQLYDGWLHLTDSEFQAQYVYWAGVHFQRNARAVWWKSSLGNLASFLLLIEGALLVWWVGAT